MVDQMRVIESGDVLFVLLDTYTIDRVATFRMLFSSCSSLSGLNGRVISISVILSKVDRVLGYVERVIRVLLNLNVRVEEIWRRRIGVDWVALRWEVLHRELGKWR